jgi:hypothetical protein
MISTSNSHRIRSARKNTIGSAMFFQENFTVLLRSNVKGKPLGCQGKSLNRRGVTAGLVAV